MIYHVSIEADDPRHVAHVLAELIGGIATPFPPVIAGSWVAFAGDDRGSAIEVYPRGTELWEVAGDADATGVIGSPERHGSTHVALGTGLDQWAVMDIAAREGWPAKYRKRGDTFGVIELWVEGCQMVELLTPEMQAEYRAGFTVENWLGMMHAVEAQRMAQAA